MMEEIAAEHTSIEISALNANVWRKLQLAPLKKQLHSLLQGIP